ncbi:cytochrome-c oxidase, cbb3-type subunit III [Novosphingobium sp. TH158]|uniref:cytochrome-c oxidase, cbb3-type subunit III n=1 Tax=Novosphingobium sp. TH158 TaxID=2067455 RepID=UPI000C7E1DD6|nr:cytochrome-c oxidase, cbb3-type subunit III [Novosphingobium sp. TH158]PLK24356.1 cytochrome-c oxidase, cbb3-type subunit III [Novosphingobium sp. TH158]
MAEQRIDEATGTATVGHEWDGIEELNTPLPRWWVLTFYASILFSIAYVVVYPAIPLLSKGTEGLWGWTSRGQLAAEKTAGDAIHAKVRAELANVPIEELQSKPELMAAAVAGGKAAFRVNCVQCHGALGAGSKGYPNLNDDDWLWGGDLKAIETTLIHGIRSPDDSATRMSLMPNFGKDGILTSAQVSDVANHVLSLSGKAGATGSGAALFAANCATCHGADGKGLRQFGAPNLSDAIWLYGGKKSDVVASINVAHAGAMPAWGKRLDPVTIKMLAAYVHSLGGGEKFAPAPAPAQPAAAAAAGAPQGQTR